SSFFSVLRLPPVSPLFPYTTLFRSDLSDLRFGCHAGGFLFGGHFLGSGERIFITTNSLGDQLVNPSFIEHAFLHQALRIDRPHADRKSTRLNSSHVSISYAVFCLKK